MRLHFPICTAAVLWAPLVCSGQITGTVTLIGVAPPQQQIKMDAAPQCAAMHKNPVLEDRVVVGKNNELANVIVFLKPAAGKTLTGPQKKTPAVLDQKGCMYTPHVLVVQTGQPVVVRNSDPFLHNVHAITFNNAPFNFAQVNVSEKKIDAFTTVETLTIRCDVHPWMNALVQVFDHPYFATTDDKGQYTIDTKGLADGTYTVQAWHEVFLESKTREIEVKSGKATNPVDFKFQ